MAKRTKDNVVSWSVAIDSKSTADAKHDNAIELMRFRWQQRLETAGLTLLGLGVAAGFIAQWTPIAATAKSDMMHVVQVVIAAVASYLFGRRIGK